MLNQLHLILQQECALGDKQPLLVGVSGGPDSLCLLDILDKLGYPVVVAHLNHRLRPEADEDAQAVAHIAEDRQLPFTSGSADVRAYAAVHQLSIEEAAREIRYRFLFEQAHQVGAQAVLVAHTADDQVETMLMHLLRGAGLAGLGGMAYRTSPTAWSDMLPLVRPLLGVWREQVLAYCVEQNLKPHFDSTNLDTTFFRNRLRHELIPYLESYNPRVRHVLWRTANTLSADYAAVSSVVDGTWESCIGNQGQGWILLTGDCLLSQPLAVQRMVIRRAVAVLRPQLRDLSFDVVERALAWLVSPPQTGQCDLVAGLRLVWDGLQVYLAAWEADLPNGDWPQWPYQPRTLNIPGKVKLPGGWQLILSRDDIHDLAFSRQNDDPYQVWMAAESLQTPLVLRARQPGDRMKPLGMDGSSMKLSDYFINRKLPQRARNAWPLIASGDEIAWVPGYHLAHPFRLTDASEKALHLRLVRE